MSSPVLHLFFIDCHTCGLEEPLHGNPNLELTVSQIPKLQTCSPTVPSIPLICLLQSWLTTIQIRLPHHAIPIFPRRCCCLIAKCPTTSISTRIGSPITRLTPRCKISDHSKCTRRFTVSSITMRRRYIHGYDCCIISAPNLMSLVACNLALISSHFSKYFQC